MNAICTSIAALGVALLIAPRPAAAQKTNIEHEFRRWVVNEMNWQPERGVNLTTTKFARHHARAYPDSQAFASTCNAVSVRGLAEKGLLVLFQTEHLDIFVNSSASKMSWSKAKAQVEMNGATLTVTPRGKPCKLSPQSATVGAMDERALNFEFADVIDGAPLELYSIVNAGCGTACAISRFEIYRLDKARLSSVFERKHTMNFSSDAPPALEPQQVELLPRNEWPEGGFSYTYVSTLELGPFVEHGPTVEVSCEWRDNAEEFSCEEKPRETFSWSDPSNAELSVESSHAKFILENIDQMRGKGWRLEPAFLQRLQALQNE